MSKWFQIKYLIRVVIAYVCIILIRGIFTYTVFIWDEEVKLNDGRVIIVTEKRRCQSGGYLITPRGLPECREREFWLSFDLPEFSPKTMVWHENLAPLILNINEGHLFVVGTPLTDIEYLQYGKPNPDYVGYLWRDGKWEKIPFDQIPTAIYDANLLITPLPPIDKTRLAYDFHKSWNTPFTLYMPYLWTNLLTLSEKNSRLLNGDIRNFQPYKRLDPFFK